MRMNKIMEKAESMVEEWKEYYKVHGEPHPSSNAYLSLTRSFWFGKGVEFGQQEFDEVGRLFGIKLCADLSNEREPEKKKELIMQTLRKAFGMPEPKAKLKESKK